MNYQRIGLLLKAAAIGAVLGAFAAMSTYPARVIWGNCPQIDCQQCHDEDVEEDSDYDGAKPSPTMLRYT